MVVSGTGSGSGSGGGSCSGSGRVVVVVVVVVAVVVTTLMVLFAEQGFPGFDLDLERGRGVVNRRKTIHAGGIPRTSCYLWCGQSPILQPLNFCEITAVKIESCKIRNRNP